MLLQQPLGQPCFFGQSRKTFLPKLVQQCIQSSQNTPPPLQIEEVLLADWLFKVCICITVGESASSHGMQLHGSVRFAVLLFSCLSTHVKLVRVNDYCALVLYASRKPASPIFVCLLSICFNLSLALCL